MKKKEIYKENKFKVFIGIIFLSLINISYFLAKGLKKLIYRYLRVTRIIRIDLVSWEPVSPWISFLRSGIQNYMQADLVVTLRTKKRWYRRFKMFWKVLLWISLLMPWWLTFKYIIVVVFNIISFIFYWILPRTWSKKFDIYILNKIRLIYIILYRIEWYINQTLYINFVLIPVIIIWLLFEIIEIVLGISLSLLFYFKITVISIWKYIVEDWIVFFKEMYKNIKEFKNSNITKYFLNSFIKGTKNEVKKKRFKWINNSFKFIIILFNTFKNWFIKVLASVLLKRKNLFIKIVIFFFNFFIVNPFIFYYNIKILINKLLYTWYIFWMNLLISIERVYTKLLFKRKTQDYRMYRNIIWILCDIYTKIRGENKVIIKKDKKKVIILDLDKVSQTYKNIYMELDQSEPKKTVIVTKNRAFVTKNKIGFRIINKLLFKNDPVSQYWLSKLYLLIKPLNWLNDRKKFDLNNILLNYLEDDLTKVKTLDKEKESINLLKIINYIMKRNINMKKHLTIHYREPEFQTEKKLYWSKSGPKEMVKDFLEFDYPNEYIAKHKYQSWASAWRRFLSLVKRRFKDWWEGEWLYDEPEKTSHILADGRFVLIVPMQTNLNELQKKVYKEDINFKWISFYNDLEDTFNLKQEEEEQSRRTKEQLIILFYLNNCYNKLERVNGLDEFKNLWKWDSSRRQLDSWWGNSDWMYYNKAHGMKNFSFYNKKSFLNFINNKYKEFWIDYTLTYTEKDFRLQNISSNSNHNYLNVLFKNKPFVRYMLNKFDIFCGEIFRSWQVPFMDSFFINNRSDIDRYKLKDRIKAYRLQQSMGESENLYDWDYSVEKIEYSWYKSILKYTKFSRLENFVYFKITDVWYKIFILVFWDLKPKDHKTSKYTFYKYLLNKFDLNWGGVTRRYDYKLRENYVMLLLWYYNYRYIFKNTNQPNFIYDNSNFKVENAIYDMIEFVQNKYNEYLKKKIKKNLLIKNIIWYINKFLIVLKVVFKMLRRLWLKLWFFINYFTPI